MRACEWIGRQLADELVEWIRGLDIAREQRSHRTPDAALRIEPDRQRRIALDGEHDAGLGRVLHVELGEPRRVAGELERFANQVRVAEEHFISALARQHHLEAGIAHRARQQELRGQLPLMHSPSEWNTASGSCSRMASCET